MQTASSTFRSPAPATTASGVRGPLVVRGGEVSRPPKKVQVDLRYRQLAADGEHHRPGRQPGDVRDHLDRRGPELRLRRPGCPVRHRPDRVPQQRGAHDRIPACSSGQTFNLSPGNGSKQITVRVTDVAGNMATDFVDGTLAGSPPTADAHVQGGTVGGGGWYTVGAELPDRPLRRHERVDGQPVGHPDRANGRLRLAVRRPARDDLRRGCNLHGSDIGVRRPAAR